MKLEFDPSVVRSAATEMGGKLVAELREKRLWPVALVLLLAIIAIPIALSKSATPARVAQLPQSPSGSPSAASIPVINQQTTPAQSRLTGPSRDPFGAPSSAPSGSTTGVASSGGASSTTSSSGTSSGSSSSSSSSSSTSSGSSSSSSPPSITQSATPKPAPAGLTATQSYDVSLAITGSSGNLNTIDPLERLSVIPSKQQPLLVELGVLHGGQRVLFVVQPGTVVNGPGTCTPGPIDCQIVSLGQDQTESVSHQTATGPVQVALFAVTAISAANHPSTGAADAARREASTDGRSLLSNSTATALSLFEYDPSVGVVVDLRNLTVGGSS